MTIDPLQRIVAAQPYPLLFATISRRRSEAMAGQGGAHLYGFSSPDSDFDLRGVPRCRDDAARKGRARWSRLWQTPGVIKTA